MDIEALIAAQKELIEKYNMLEKQCMELNDKINLTQQDLNSVAKQAHDSINFETKLIEQLTVTEKKLKLALLPSGRYHGVLIG